MARKKSQAIAARPVGLKILGAPFELYPTGLTVVGKPSQEEYDEAFGRLNLIESAQSWWYGDLANAREKHYGSLDEMADRLEIDYNALHVYQYVSSRYEHVTRVTCLAFKHHQIADQFGVSQSTISSVVRDYSKRKDLISEHLRSRGHLKSVVRYSDRGPWGDAKFPGNTSGYLLVDLIDYYQPKSILDPMEGSGTTGDVAFDMGDIRYTGLDLLSGFDLVGDEPEGEYDLIFWHPPYHDAVDYDIPHPNNLSRCPSLSDYLDKLKLCMVKLLSHLSQGGHLCILCSDPRKDGIIQPIHSAIISFNLTILEAALVKLIEGRSRYFDYGNAPFIPIVHEYVLIFFNKRV